VRAGVAAPHRVPPVVPRRGPTRRLARRGRAVQGVVPRGRAEARGGPRRVRRATRALGPLVPVTDVVFPLTPRRRLIGLSFGGMRSSRRGTRSDVAGSRNYRPGDDIDTTHCAAPARLTAAPVADQCI